MYIVGEMFKFGEDNTSFEPVKLPHGWIIGLPLFFFLISVSSKLCRAIPIYPFYTYMETFSYNAI